jgi:glucosamine--fructose-6-phosphate aminotransferase (isomerizing)
MLWENKMAHAQLTGLDKLYEETFPAIDHRLRNLFTAGDLLAIKKVYVLGDGDSYHVALASRTAFLNLTDVEYFPVPAMRFLGYEIDCMRDYSPGQSLVVGVSASGESRRVVQCLERARQKMPDASFVAMTGNPRSSVARAADHVFDVSLPNPELGKAPGIRTYVASLFGLAALSIRLGEMQTRYHMTEANTMRNRIAAQGEYVARIIEQSDIQAKEICRYAVAPFFMTAGSGNHLGTASFSAAKLTEIAGLFCVPQDLEEWMHVERFSYPLNTPLIVFAPKGVSFNHALTLMETARKMGHPVIAITDTPENETVKSLAEIIFPVYGTLEEHFMQLLFYIPSVSMGVAFSQKLGRAMFMTDNEAIQKQRAAMTQNLKEEM